DRSGHHDGRRRVALRGVQGAALRPAAAAVAHGRGGTARSQGRPRLLRVRPMTAIAQMGPSTPEPAATEPTTRPRHAEVPRAQRTIEALRDVGLDDLLVAERFAHVDAATVASVVDEFVRFVDEVVTPTDRDGDVIGCTVDVDASTVTTAPGSVD